MKKRLNIQSDTLVTLRPLVNLGSPLDFRGELSPGPSKRLEMQPGSSQTCLPIPPAAEGRRRRGCCTACLGTFPAAFRATVRVLARAPPRKSKGLPRFTKGLRVLDVVALHVDDLQHPLEGLVVVEAVEELLQLQGAALVGVQLRAGAQDRLLKHRG